MVPIRLAGSARYDPIHQATLVCFSDVLPQTKAKLTAHRADQSGLVAAFE